MNELMVVYSGGQWLYFKTQRTIIGEAYREYTEMMSRLGVNIDNMHPERAILRDADGSDIGAMQFALVFTEEEKHNG